MAISEWQILFNKIKHDIGSPFGVIREVFFYDYSPNNPNNNNSPQLKQFLEYKCHFIGFVETFIGPSESLFFVYKNGPSATFNLKNYLLVLAKIHCNPTAICYCENKQDAQINLVVTPGLAPWKTTVEIEKHRIKTIDNHYRQSSEQNIKINEIADDLKSGKIVGKKIISDALLSTNYCFMDDENLKDLKKLLSQDQINLSNIIVSAINQAENVNGINLTSAIIDKIEYHFRDNTFHFIFNVSDNFLSGKSRLTIEVPRKALENIKLPDMKEICVNQWYIDIFRNILIQSIKNGSYIIEGIKLWEWF
ncbi:hypothetical protein [Helicobacter pylori]|uniref:hypothetical protein n=1 Tax=Helicobacter pylori TaxID=210 RepID=UPI000EAFDE92|nr:hypothetical protein [Helicobacter pylori]RKV31726.1 hypothetical protein DD756_03380 [Helicobacter pylori]